MLSVELGLKLDSVRKQYFDNQSNNIRTAPTLAVLMVLRELCLDTIEAMESREIELVVGGLATDIDVLLHERLIELIDERIKEMGGTIPND